MRGSRLVIASCTVGLTACGLLNSLDYLQSGGVRPSDGGGGDAAADVAFDGPFVPDPSFLNGVVDVALAANYTSCALRVDKKVYCWGWGAAGQLGIPEKQAPESSDEGGFSSRPLFIAFAPSVRSLGGGGRHLCAIDESSTVKCWGNNSFCATGQLPCTTDPADIGHVATEDGGALGGALGLGLGVYHGCARVSGDAVVCWGENGYFQTGTTVGSERAPSGPVAGAKAIALAAGLTYTCALSADQSLHCWGNDGSGVLGGIVPEGGAQTATPIDSAPGHTFVSIGGGAHHVCAIDGSGDLWCWGDGSKGQTGGGGAGPHRVTLPGSAKQVVGGNEFTCALLQDGRVACLGANDFGQLGNGTTNTSSNPTASVVDGIAGASAVAAGWDRACAVVGGYVHCWGNNAHAALGDGTQTARSRPVRVIAP